MEPGVNPGATRGLPLLYHREPISHDTAITSGRADGSSIELQETDGIRRSIKASGRGRAETRQPSHAAERLQECGKAPEAGGAAHRLNPLADGLQGVGDLMTNLSMMLMVGMEVKARETTISHVEADLEKTHHRPLPGAPNV
jgi:hypothetical protein